MFSAQLREYLDQLDEILEQRGYESFTYLESVHEAAVEEGRKRDVADSSMGMAVRLKTVANNLAIQNDEPDKPRFADRKRCADLCHEAFSAAVALLDESLDAVVDLNDQSQARQVQYNLGDAHVGLGELDAAITHYRFVLETIDPDVETLLYYQTCQKAGDVLLMSEDDQGALEMYERSLAAAEALDDPLAVSGEHSKVASALRNLQRFDQALTQFEQSRTILRRLSTDEALRAKIKLNKELFDVAFIPMQDAYTVQRMNEARDAIGRLLIRCLPDQIALAFVGAAQSQEGTYLTGSPSSNELELAYRRAFADSSTDSPNSPNWASSTQLELAVRSAISALIELRHLGIESQKISATGESTLKLVGSFTRSYFGEHVEDPPSIYAAARYLMQVDRSSRTAMYLRDAENSQAGPGPYGGANSSTILYLRSFNARPHLPSFDLAPWGRVDLEDYLAAALDAAPMIALGKPDLRHFGAGYAETTDEDWQRVLKQLATEAHLILLLPAPTKGTSWEIEWTVSNLFLHKTLTIMPPSEGECAAWWTINWEQMRQWARASLNLDFPPYHQDGGLFLIERFPGRTKDFDFSLLYSDELRQRLLSAWMGNMTPDWNLEEFFLGLGRWMAEHPDKQAGPSVEESNDLE
jgi:tetratricopeptide (TPR) repeat protein